MKLRYHSETLDFGVAHLRDPEALPCHLMNLNQGGMGSACSGLMRLWRGEVSFTLPGTDRHEVYGTSGWQDNRQRGYPLHRRRASHQAASATVAGTSIFHTINSRHSSAWNFPNPAPEAETRLTECLPESWSLVCFQALFRSLHCS